MLLGQKNKLENMNMKNLKVDLTLLKKLVAELETSLAASESIRGSKDPSLNDFVVECSKAAGLAAGVMQESSMLILDIQSLVRASQSPAPKGGGDFLDKLLGGMKPGGGNAN
jgi:hypothetical protein